MKTIIGHERCRLYHGDSIDLGTVLDENSVDSIVCDPPAGIDFMGKGWDSDKGGRDAWIAWLRDLMGAAFKALKPGGYALVWALPRTSHWTATALEDAGFEIRDVHHHIFGTGFPKSLDIGKATGGAKWAGFGTALKPAVEHWILCRKPLIGTYAENVLTHGTGGLNIAACRIGTDGEVVAMVQSNPSNRSHGEAVQPGAGSDLAKMQAAQAASIARTNSIGRWPAHLSLEHAEACSEGACVLGCPVRLLDEQSGACGAAAPVKGTEPSRAVEPGTVTGTRERVPGKFHGDKGGASRFFYVAKGARSEKDAGLGHVESRHGAEATAPRNHHPTVKSIALMRWLVRLVTPPGGTVLDPFAGSGTTGVAALAEGLSFVGVEQGGKDGEYIPIVSGRLRHALG